MSFLTTLIPLKKEKDKKVAFSSLLGKQLIFPLPHSRDDKSRSKRLFWNSLSSLYETGKCVNHFDRGRKRPALWLVSALCLVKENCTNRPNLHFSVIYGTYLMYCTMCVYSNLRQQTKTLGQSGLSGYSSESGKERY